MAYPSETVHLKILCLQFISLIAIVRDLQILEPDSFCMFIVDKVFLLKKISLKEILTTDLLKQQQLLVRLSKTKVYYGLYCIYLNYPTLPVLCVSFENPLLLLYLWSLSEEIGIPGKQLYFSVWDNLEKSTFLSVMFFLLATSWKAAVFYLTVILHRCHFPGLQGIIGAELVWPYLMDAFMQGGRSEQMLSYLSTSFLVLYVVCISHLQLYQWYLSFNNGPVLVSTE